MNSAGRALSLIYVRGLLLLLAAGVCPVQAEQSSNVLASQALELASAFGRAPLNDGELSIFVGASSGTLLLTKLTIWIDGEEAVHYEYSESQAHSLATGAL